MTESSKSKFWLDLTADEVVDHYPDGKILVSSGHSPSGVYHIGTIREMLTAHAIAWALRQRGRDADHVDFVDDFDVLRKIPAGLSESLRSELGKPLFAAASPENGVSYGEYFYRDLRASAEAIGFAADTTYFAATTYLKEHRYTEAITKSLDGLEDARVIIEEVSHRRLPSDWAPVQLLSENDRLNEWHYTGHNIDSQLITYRTNDGKEGELSYAEGRVKLDWRLDWPARWWMWGIGVEPFGRDHATKGGSYDTGKVLVERIFGGQAPIPVPYEFIMEAGHTKKFSKSAGGVITPKDALEVMPAEVLRYFVVRSKPSRQLFFDSGTGLYNLIDEFAQVGSDPEHEYRDAYAFAVADDSKPVISTVPFKHLVQVYQAAQGDADEVLRILERTGHAEAVAEQRGVILQELPFIKNWLERFAPEEARFSVQKSFHAPSLTDSQRGFLKILATAIDIHEGEIDGQIMHQLIYTAKDQADISPQDAFQALYRVILGKDYGPKAGWFLASLERSWLVKRLEAAV